MRMSGPASGPSARIGTGSRETDRGAELEVSQMLTSAEQKLRRRVLISRTVSTCEGVQTGRRAVCTCALKPEGRCPLVALPEARRSRSVSARHQRRRHFEQMGWTIDVACWSSFSFSQTIYASRPTSVCDCLLYRCARCTLCSSPTPDNPSVAPRLHAEGGIYI